MRFAILIAALAFAPIVEARSQVEKRLFAKLHPCPAAGHHKPPSCPGYVIDHVIPLCAGGPDLVTNMQWQTVSAGAKKDRREIAYCACIRIKGKASCTFTP